MKNSVKKSLSVILAVVMIAAVALQVNAVNFSETKTSAFLKKFASEKALNVQIEDINENPLSVSNIVLSAKLKDDDSVDIKASADVKLSFLSAKAYFDGKELLAYLWIFKINASQIAKDALGYDLVLTEDQTAQIASIMKDIIKLADSPVLSALTVDSQTDTSEKFSVSAMALLTAASGASEAEVQAAMALAGYDITGKTDKEIKDMLVAANKAGALLPLLKAAGSDVTQEDLDLVMDYIYDTFEFTYSGNDVKDIAVYGENGEEIFKLSSQIPYAVKSIGAGEGNVKKAPAFGIDITGMISGIIKSILSSLA